MRSVLLLLAVLLASCGDAAPIETPPPYIVVANRADGTFSVIDTDTDTLVRHVPLPGGAKPATPGYVAYVPRLRRLYVGDDANRRISVFQVPEFFHLFDLPMPADVFHLWVNDRQLWAVDRDALSLAVFDLDSSQRIGVIPIPADLRARGGVPHDVVVDATHAYVTVFRIAAAPDVVVKYSCDTLTEVGRASVGDDPHVFLHPTAPRLYVACQDTDNVFVLDRATMAEITVVPIFGGHGVWVPPPGQTLYVTNFPSHVVGGEPGPGALGVFAVDLDTDTAIGGVGTSRTGAHNLNSTADGTKLYITHSDGGSMVGVYDVSDPDAVPVFLREILVGKNPFGIARLE